MKVLVIGSGGREHTIVWKLKQSKQVSKIYCIPGNGGMYDLAECYPDIPYEKNFTKLIQFAKKNNIGLTIVGPEDPLANGVVDAFKKNNLAVFGPSGKAAQLEASKNFAKKIMKKGHIPTGEYELFTDHKKALSHIKKIKYPVVIKADGLAKGKGVYIVKSVKEAQTILNDIMLKRIFGEAGDKVIIEEFLKGDEFTVLSFVDGKHFSVMPLSRDHKKLLDNDKGPNTGGMGAFAPTKMDKKDYAFVNQKIIAPMIKTLNKEKITYKGVLYTGLIKTRSGFKVLEFNCRFGDPEAQVILPLLKTDLIDIMKAVIKGTLNKLKIKWSDKKVMTVVAVSKGYPDKYAKGYQIQGIRAITDPDSVVFHAGTKIHNNMLLSSGGRVLNITAIADNFKKAREKAYSIIQKIHFKDMAYRKDIGKKLR